MCLVVMVHGFLQTHGLHKSHIVSLGNPVGSALRPKEHRALLHRCLSLILAQTILILNEKIQSTPRKININTIQTQYNSQHFLVIFLFRFCLVPGSEKRPSPSFRSIWTIYLGYLHAHALYTFRCHDALALTRPPSDALQLARLHESPWLHAPCCCVSAAFQEGENDFFTVTIDSHHAVLTAFFICSVANFLFLMLSSLPCLFVCLAKLIQQEYYFNQCEGEPLDCRANKTKRLKKGIIKKPAAAAQFSGQITRANVVVGECEYMQPSPCLFLGPLTKLVNQTISVCSSCTGEESFLHKAPSSIIGINYSILQLSCVMGAIAHSQVTPAPTFEVLGEERAREVSD